VDLDSNLAMPLSPILWKEKNNEKNNNNNNVLFINLWK